MKLSVVIVNYNVKYFLEQCLHSAIKAASGISSEIIVVDNNSVDGSCQMLIEKFPEIILISNDENVGFSKANNQAIRISKGEYVLLLNPDTVVEEDSFKKIIKFMDENPETGGLGVKMIDGRGRFLPESKRGLPTPMTAFWKIFGFSSLFPKSKIFSNYHLGHLDKDKIHDVDVLAGAFMLLRAETLKKVGLLDEDFFMYGEDIDLSYRITLGGYKNVYFPETTIIHYKGESTKKGSINYVRVFYNAMIIFAKKHFSTGNAKRYTLLINLAIYFRAILTLLSNIIRKIYLPVFDSLLIWIGFALILPFWEEYKFEKGYYPEEYLLYAVPVYIIIWLICIWAAGGYRKNIKLGGIYKGLIWGGLAILVFYSLIDESLRYSRAMLVLGFVWSFLVLPFYRLLLSKSKIFNLEIKFDKPKRIAIVAYEAETVRISKLIEDTGLNLDIIGFVAPDKNPHHKFFLGNLNQISEIIRINRINELIFSSVDLSSQEIISIMLDLNNLNIDYKIAPPQSHSIIGSNSVSSSGDLYEIHINSISTKNNKLIKRAFDIVISIAAFFVYPFLFIIPNVELYGFGDIFSVFIGRKSWVGYSIGVNDTLPEIKPGVYSPSSVYSGNISEQLKDDLNVIYARNYNISNDLEIMIKSIINKKKL